jgi:SPP1 gp7 family putative phage head morphogenesis protein
MTSREYWLERDAANQAFVDKEVAAHMRRLQKLYHSSLSKIDKQIKELYLKFLEDGEVVSTTSLYKYGRFAQLKTFTEKELGILGTAQETECFKTLEKIYREVFGKTYDALGTSVKWGFTEQSQLDKVLNSAWSGKHFSQRIWANTNDLAYTIEKQIKDLVSMGKMPTDIRKEIMNTFNVGINEADRLLRTEAMHVYNASAANAYQNNGISEYIFVAAHDSRTSDICRQHDGKTYKFSEAVAGVNIAPLHPNCRSTIIPVVTLNIKSASQLSMF